MNIYTKTGDRGETSLVGGRRVSKCCQRLESYGTLDELNAHIGLLAAEAEDMTLPGGFIRKLQDDLFTCGAYLASEDDRCPCIGPEAVSALEKEIDRLEATLPPLRSFILPGGCKAAAEAHVCRTVCRRVEREVLRLKDEGIRVEPALLCYFNRLSDYFFVLARALNREAGHEERCWQPNKDKK